MSRSKPLPTVSGERSTQRLRSSADVKEIASLASLSVQRLATRGSSASSSFLLLSTHSAWRMARSKRPDNKRGNDRSNSESSPDNCCGSWLYTVIVVDIILIVACAVVAKIFLGAEHLPLTLQRFFDGASSSNTLNVTFVNLMSEDDCSLLWKSSATGGPIAIDWPIQRNGGRLTLEVSVGQSLAFARAGSLQPLVDHTVTSGVKVYEVTDADAANALQASGEIASASSEPALAADVASAAACRAMLGCRECVNLAGCGWSVVRHACFIAHPIATDTDVSACDGTAASSNTNAEALTAQQWYSKATRLASPLAPSYAPQALRDAYRALEHGARAAAESLISSQPVPTEAGEAAQAAASSISSVAISIEAARSELAAKLEAVFDDADAKQLLEQTRHPKLAAVHPKIPMVARRRLKDALPFVARGEPVVITGFFDTGVFDAVIHGEGGEVGGGSANGGKDARRKGKSKSKAAAVAKARAAAAAYPVAHKWTLEYLRRRIFKAESSASSTELPPVLNVATDVKGACCRYYEPRRVAIQANYPYPFRPRTHLYRETFDGFVSTLRAAASAAAKRGEALASDASDASDVDVLAGANSHLHYLHDIVISDGQPQLAGDPAPPPLAADLGTTAASLLPLAKAQPFFGSLAYAKLWIGMRGIVMPLHYDATDNLYVMGWGRKRAYLAEPGQLGALYRYPNGHPHVGSSQVNLSAPDMDRFPGFASARLRELVVGPGDIL